MKHFSELSLLPALLETLTQEGYSVPTPVQAKAIPPALEGKDLLGCAQTGTGKTAAFALPVLQRLANTPWDRATRGAVLPRALVLSPTRELATQIVESFATYGRKLPLHYAVIFGGVSQFHQVRALQRGVDVLVATPGRLEDLMRQRLVNLSAVEVFVLDEADRMLDMGFIQPIRRVASVLRTDRQTMLFSATMPREIQHLADSLLKNPTRVAVTPVASTAPLIEQSVYHVPKPRKQALLQHLLQFHKIERAIVFTRTKHGADRVCEALERSGVSSQAIHGNKAQNQRQRALDAFRTGRSRVLVATDVAARGLDVDGISHVFNYDLPNEPEAYVHRIGRTGRAGMSGVAISFCDAEERGLLRDIERLTGKKIMQASPSPEHAVFDPGASSGATIIAPPSRHEPRPSAQLQPRAPRDEQGAHRSNNPPHRRDGANGRPARPDHHAPRPRPESGAPRPAHAAEDHRRGDGHPLPKPAPRGTSSGKPGMKYGTGPARPSFGSAGKGKPSRPGAPRGGRR